MTKALFLAGVVLMGLAARPARAQSASQKPRLLRDVGIDQKLNEQVPLDLVFREENGQAVELRQYFGAKPVILSLVYYDCPMLCTQVLNGLLRSLRNLNLDIGRNFNVVTVSFDPREKPAEAARKKELYAGLYSRPGGSSGWHFLTGDEPSIRSLTQAVGFRYAYDAESGQFAHATGVMVLTPEGRISRYFYGIEYPSRDLRLGLVEASREKIGSPVDQILLYCYHYDPATGKYGLVILNVVRAAGVATVLLLGTGIWLLFRRERTVGAA